MIMARTMTMMSSITITMTMTPSMAETMGGSVSPFEMDWVAVAFGHCFFKIQLPREWELRFGGSVSPFEMDWVAVAFGHCFFNTTPKGVGDWLRWVGIAF